MSGYKITNSDGVVIVANGKGITVPVVDSINNASKSIPEGTILYSSATKQIYRFDGTDWQIAAGSSGTAGSSGSSGSSGSTGTSGSSGTSGTVGSSGSSGTSGTRGSSGSSGTAGTSGTSGSSGSTGTSGSSGSSGTTGSSGSSGSAGTSGSSGSSGASGSSGSAGTSGQSVPGGLSIQYGGTTLSNAGWVSQQISYSGANLTSNSGTLYISGTDGNGNAIQNGSTATLLDQLVDVATNGALGHVLVIFERADRSKANFYSYTAFTKRTPTGNTDAQISSLVYLGGSATSTFTAPCVSFVIVGRTGQLGSSGTSGSSGLSGSSGSSGFSGSSGSTGSSGSSGQTGVAGSSGSSGSTGTSGTSGSSGSSGTRGSSGSSGSTGTSGTSGSSGSSGNTGAAGSSGSSGQSGAAGTSGSSGSSGNTGAAGSSGSSGQTGAAGSSGSSGQSGAAGSSGSSGQSGAAGSSGSSGQSGAAGTSGSSGSSGTRGSSGTSGQNGAAGSSGSSGQSGAAGSSGSSGQTGAAGSSGSSGQTGAAGSSGTSGISPSAALYIAKGENVDTTLGNSTDNRAAVLTFNVDHTNTFSANSDIGDTMRVIAVQNPNTASTNGLYTAIHMQIGALSSVRTMGDIKFVRNSGHEGKWYFTASTTAAAGTHADLIAFSNSDFTYKGNNVWHAGNDGSGSGLDADLLDGYHQTDFVRLSANSSSPTNGTFAMGSASGRNFIQSHSSQPLDLNPLGNQVFINGSEAVRNTGTWSISVTGTAGSETLATVTGRGASASVDIITSSGFQGRFYRVREASANRGGLYPYNLIFGSGTDYSLGLFSEGELYLASGGSATKRFTMNNSGAANFTGNLTAANLSGTNTGDQTNISGSSSTVTHFAGRTDGTAYNVVWAAGNPSHLYSCNAVQIQSSTGTLTATTLSSSNLNIGDGNVELYKSQTIDMSGGSFSTGTYYPVIISVPTSGVTIQIQNNLNSNVPSWSTHPAGFTINLVWTTNASGWGTTAVNRSVLQWHERFTNVTICGGITQMGTSSQEVVWLRGGGVYNFIYSRNISGFASSTNYTNPFNTESANISNSIVNSPWAQSVGRMSYGEIYSPGDIIAYSDASVKENIRPINNALERVLSTRGVIYDRIDTGSKDNIGFIAQEIEINNPELVSTDEAGKKSVKYQNTTALLIEAIKEQQTIIESQNQKIKNLENLFLGGETFLNK